MVQRLSPTISHWLIVRWVVHVVNVSRRTTSLSFKLVCDVVFHARLSQRCL